MIVSNIKFKMTLFIIYVFEKAFYQNQKLIHNAEELSGALGE